MTTRTWKGGTADWNTDAYWTPATSGNDVPLPGDAVVIAAGTVILTTNIGPNPRFETNQVTLGGAAGATLLLRNREATGRHFNVAVAGAATIEADGDRGLAGSLTGTVTDGSTITLKGDPGGELVLLHGGSLDIRDKTVDFEGAVTLERDALVSGDVVNDGTLSILSGTTTLGADLTGTGTIVIGGYGVLSAPSSVPATQTISFEGRGGGIRLENAFISSFAGSIRNFAPGDFIDFYAGGSQQVSGTVDAAAHVLTLTSEDGHAYVLNNFYGAAGTLFGLPGADGFARLVYKGAAPQLNYQIDAGARAMHADLVHGMTIPGSAAAITGAGVKVGIISGSFNVGGGAAADAAAGYLPAAGVTVLREGAAGDDDEGRAMAELIHQTAPGASLYFSSAGSGAEDFASSVRALQAAGCTVIVDDISLIGSEPFFQLGSPAENAISDAIAAGVSYVTSAGNYGDACYEHAFTTTRQTLFDGSVVQAMSFSNGTAYQSVTATGGLDDQIDLQWDAPFYGTGGTASDQPCSVAFKVFDPATGALIGTSHQVGQAGHLVAESELSLPYSDSKTNYDVAIYRTDGTPAAGRIKYLITGSATGAGAGGRINDPDAGVGSGAIFGHQLVPGAIAVAAADLANTSASGRSPDFTQSFTSTGPGALLFDASGNRLATPVAAGSPDVTAPDGIQTSVPGFTPFYGTSAAAPDAAGVVALLQQVKPGIAPDAAASILARSAAPLSNEPASAAGAGLVQADAAVALAEAACFAAGTHLATPGGPVPVQDLRPGDAVILAGGGCARIRWAGRRRIDCARHPDPQAVLPVRVRAGAFGEGRPRRDLFLSPDHAVLADGFLIPVRLLINGGTITQAAAGAVTYCHVELARHGVILAEGLACESYLESGNRHLFDVAFGDPPPRARRRPAAALAFDEARVRPVWERLARRARAAGHAGPEPAVTDDAAMSLLGARGRIAPVHADGRRCVFALPAGEAGLRLRSRTARPCDLRPWCDDRRRLGVSVTEIVWHEGERRTALPVDHPGLHDGWWSVERAGGRQHRWTDGDALLPPMPGATAVEIRLAGAAAYPAA